MIFNKNTSNRNDFVNLSYIDFFSFSPDTVSPDIKRTTSYSKFSSEGRVDVLQAKKHLESARRDFKTIGAYSREKDVMYLMVSIWLVLFTFASFCIQAYYDDPMHSIRFLFT